MTATLWRLALVVPAALLALSFDSSIARADRRDHRGGGVRVHGGVRIGGSVRVGRSSGLRPYSRGAGPYRVRVRSHPRVYPRYYWGGGMYFGVRYAYPPPCYECGPSYYSSPYYEQPAVAAVAVAPQPPLPKFGLGLFAGGTSLDNGVEGDDLGVLGRFRLTPHLQLEGELSKSELFDSQRIDRSMGGALLYDFAPWSRLSLNVLGGLGVGSSEVSGDVSARHVYGELGVGLEWRLTDHLSLIGDLRAGQRDVEYDETVVALGRAPALSLADEQEYTRGRLGLLLFF